MTENNRENGSSEDIYYGPFSSEDVIKILESTKTFHNSSESRNEFSAQLNISMNVSETCITIATLNTESTSLISELDSITYFKYEEFDLLELSKKNGEKHYIRIWKLTKEIITDIINKEEG